MKKPIVKIMLWSAAALIIPLLGNTFVDGWNWTWHDFLFAWTFFVVMSLSIRLATQRIVKPAYRFILGTAVFLIFALIWVILATG